ncbi:response regulator transcription factor [Solirubrum puertoriconensis]|uniref:Response regulatory domain-containing protein n=1 Tax=Solirubrum puertoriconensis TaxID=1751427 RepID=A0A9X0L5U8_SOLP1|nr:response regulator transcription factor [Solirubrum puertoriconensis]KUG09021.1 hypothetical protein ASU33_19550 [Solirubrum puertoriconensis]
MTLFQHILIVEVGAPLRLGLLRQFARWGFAHVTAVETSGEALAQAAACRPDLVVLSAPWADSQESLNPAQQLLARCGPVPVLVLVPETWQLCPFPTSWPGIASSRCVPKPPTPEQLQHGVEQSLCVTLAEVA